MLGDIWFQFLYQPLFNVLVLIYNTIAEQNLGWAIVWLTIFLRLILLPLSIISEKNSRKHEKVEEEAKKAALVFKNDRVAQQEEFRKIMKRHKVSPWAKVVVLLVQVLVLVLLYQVFMRGVTGEKVIKILYSFIDYPGKINTMFYGFDVGFVHDYVWAGLAAGLLFLTIFFEHKKGELWQRGEAVYLFLFPIFTFSILWILPMVKSLFILTTMIFSIIINLLSKLFFPVKKQENK